MPQIEVLKKSTVQAAMDAFDGATAAANLAAANTNAAIDTANTAADNADSKASLASNAAALAESSSEQALFAAGVDEDFISNTVDTLPDSTGAVEGTIGAYPKTEGHWQLVEWDDTGSQWVERGIPFVSYSGLKIDNVTALRSRRGLIDGQTVELLGYNDPGEGGGTLYWDATSEEDDNGGNVFQVTGVVTGRWKRPKKNNLVATEWGAALDGTTDDYDRLQAALDYLDTNGGGKLLIPYSASGFMLKSTLVVKSNVTLDAGNNVIKTDALGTYDDSGALIMLGALSSEATSADGILETNCHLKFAHTDAPDVSRPFYMSNCSNSSIMWSGVKNNQNAFFDRRSENNLFAHNYSEDLEFQMFGGGGATDPDDIGDRLTIFNNSGKRIGAEFADVRNKTVCYLLNNKCEEAAGFFKCQEEGSAIIIGNEGTFFDSENLFRTIRVDSDNFIVKGNKFERNDQRPHIQFLNNASNNIITNNIFEHDSLGVAGNSLFDGAVRVDDTWNGENNVIDNNTFIALQSRNSVIWFNDSVVADRKRFIITNNRIIQKVPADGSTATRNTIRIANVDDAVIAGNMIESNRDTVTSTGQKGIYVKDCLNADVRNNTILGDPQRGVDISVGTNTNSKIMHNTIIATFEGISLPAGQNILQGFNTINNVHETTASIP